MVNNSFLIYAAISKHSLFNFLGRFPFLINKRTANNYLKALNKNTENTNAHPTTSQLPLYMCDKNITGLL